MGVLSSRKLARLIHLTLLLASVGCISSPACAQRNPDPHKLHAATTLAPLPAGLTIPLRIDRTYRAGRIAPGTAIVGTTTQRIPIGNRQYLRYGIKVIGTVVASTAADKATGQPATLALRFTAINDRGQTAPLVAQAIAVANFTDVADTDIPVNANLGRGTASIASMTTHQIGEDEVSRSGWDGVLVDARLERVGFADHYGVYTDPVPGSSGAAAIPHALGVFSTDAAGLYGFDSGAELHFLNGSITITAPHKLILRNGDELLLRVLP